MTSTTVTTAAIDRFLDGVVAGAGIDPAVYAADAVLDATVPGWRFSASGPEGIADAYRRWFADPGAFEELDRLPIPGGEVVRYFLTWVERGLVHAAHHCHVLLLDDGGLIRRDTVFCGGRWDAGLLAQMAEADR
jgi:hypothetical protein